MLIAHINHNFVKQRQMCTSTFNRFQYTLTEIHLSIDDNLCCVFLVFEEFDTFRKKRHQQKNKTNINIKTMPWMQRCENFYALSTRVTIICHAYGFIVNGTRSFRLEWTQ